MDIRLGVVNSDNWRPEGNTHSFIFQISWRQFGHLNRGNFAPARCIRHSVQLHFFCVVELAHVHELTELVDADLREAARGQETLFLGFGHGVFVLLVVPTPQLVLTECSS